MKIPLEITVRGMPHSEAVEKKIRQRALGLERYSRRIQRCEVWLEAAHRHHRKGPFYAVRVRLTAKQEEIAVDFQPGQDDVYVAIRQAFDAVRRQLQDYERRWPGQTRGHEGSRRRPAMRKSAAAAASIPPGPEGSRQEA
jgi:ribosomal subunit interface protein